MYRFFYRLSYRLGHSPWDSGTTPPEVVAAWQVADIPPGAALDLGCGTGTNVVFMARQGRRAIGVDFVPAAIARARDRAQQAGLSASTQFHIGDVTRLAALALPACGFALDMGCFHGLSPDGQRRYADGLAGVLVPGGRYMLYTLNPRKEAGLTFGIQPACVREVFAPRFSLVRTAPGSFWGKDSTWFWMERR